MKYRIGKFKITLNLFLMQKKITQQPCYCYLCQKSKMFEISNPKIKTTKLCVLILRSLKMLHPEMECYSIKTDINEFIQSHWDMLVKLKIFQSTQWKKAILDALNHCPLIECGKDFCHDRGYYRLKDNETTEKKEETPNPSFYILTHKNSKQNISQELYSCYDDLQRQLSYSVKVFSKLYSKYLRNCDTKRSELVRDILERQNQVYDLFGNYKLQLCSFE
ncbi:hypothetical protein EDI_129900 [Entamoeba dispar SAW760]|uniref:Uncharacterized protein n=1 Tax=Entamoeba dispar (strain ATCC PRA-260 / SAW760) TaxID=370354 RepID=B0EDP3_ENTDS|nr:uncharacterized protein EDI_129900 [Entamoeba dispar SAW760]EDR27363.1 hypothetical protein EDI_129900 [Entamoeba dispar SAW760]|eukprot:EDR27363.1 hypothetical protein EDI_129900 [Entamoeba dispar SAW760]